ncbi:hypothetical protein [Streptomyces guryensis]|uniref:Uncharacterized protein n=1 Tax=Streptomyces guryensis TaxID=2886947 RepID=A0A9Q3VUA3_9ACTN|nr:hypothetical protein [Streptomyces guryensis]MCD9878581.1 hypothetical protein [Streptomyces guryensis]
MNAVVRAWRSVWSRWTLLAVVCLLLTMDAYGVSFFGSGRIDPKRVGDLGEWFAGAATAGAVIMAASGLRRDRIESELARDRRERAATGEVYSWVELRQLRPGRKTPVLLVVNRTTSPIYDWKVTLIGCRHRPVSHETHGPLLPEARVIELDEDDLAHPTASSPVKTMVSFTSSVGKRLKRDSSGLLTEVEQ